MVSPQKNTPSLGFSLIELIVSISIVTIVTGIVIARHNAFNGAILLRNQAYEIAFVVHEAQQLAVSGQTSDLNSTQKQRYGVAFSTGTTGDINKQSILLYKDNNNNRLYDAATDDEIKTYRLDNRFEIARIMTGSSSGSNMRVVFERPFFDAKFYRDNLAAIQSGPARIIIRPVNSTASNVPERVINISNSGQITVESN